jgi:hypothetical protein
MNQEKIDAIMKSTLPDSEKSRLISELMGIKTKPKKQYTPQQIENAKDRLKLAREAKEAKKAIKETIKEVPKETPVQKQSVDVKAIEDIFEKKYSSEMAKMGDLLLDLNKNISEMAKLKKQKAEEKKLMEEDKKKKELEKPKEEPKKEVIAEQPKVVPAGKVAFPNYRNIFGKK